MLGEKIKIDFPVFNTKVRGKRLIYLDNACTVLKSNKVIASIIDYYSRCGACGGDRSSHLLSYLSQEMTDRARDRVKRFIRCPPDGEIIWTRNTTEGINLIAHSFPFRKKKKEVVLFLADHHSCVLPFLQQAKRGNCVLKFLRPLADGTVDLGEAKKSITGNTALIAISHISNVMGHINPVRELALLAHAQGAKLLVDDAQYIATHQEDVEDNKIDFLAFSGHKIGGPTGIGVLYMKKGLVKTLQPFNVGGGTVESFKISGNRSDVKYASTYKKFEAGIQNYAGIVGLKAAIEYLQDHSYPQITRWVENLAAYAYRGLSEMPEVKFLCKYKNLYPKTLIAFCFEKKKLSLYDFNIYLNNHLSDYFIALRCGHHCSQPLHAFFGVPHTLRLSFFIYNSIREIDIFLNALRQYVKKK